MFKGGQLSMYPTGPWMNAMIKADNPTLKYGFAPFPVNGSKPQATVVGHGLHGAVRDVREQDRGLDSSSSSCTRRNTARSSTRRRACSPS